MTMYRIKEERKIEEIEKPMKNRALKLQRISFNSSSVTIVTKKKGERKKKTYSRTAPPVLPLHSHIFFPFFPFSNYFRYYIETMPICTSFHSNPPGMRNT